MKLQYKYGNKIELRGDILDNKEKKKKDIIQVGLVIFAMVLYIVYGVQILPPLILLIPVPFIVLGVKNGFSWNLLSIILTLLIVEIFLGDTIGASLVIIFAPLSLAINYCIEKRKNSKQTVLIATLFFLVPLLILLVLGMKIADIDLINQMDVIFTEYISIQTEALREIGLTNHKILEVVNNLESRYNELIMLIPSLISIFSMFIAYINYFFTGVVLRKMGYELIKRPRFSRFRLPNNFLLGVGVMLLSGFVFNWLDFQYSQSLLLNIIFLAGSMFIIQGLSVLDFLLIKMNIKLVFRVILIALNLIFLPMGSIIIFVGLLDSVFDMRKLRSLKS